MLYMARRLRRDHMGGGVRRALGNPIVFEEADGANVTNAKENL